MNGWIEEIRYGTMNNRTRKKRKKNHCIYTMTNRKKERHQASNQKSIDRSIQTEMIDTRAQANPKKNIKNEKLT